MYSNLKFLDSFRGLAALYVVIGHARWLLWEGFSGGYLQHPEEYSVIGKILVYFFSVFKFGHEAVLFFFVLSGFVIHLNYSEKLNTLSNKVKNAGLFLFKRFNRIYPALIISILITVICDYIGNYQYEALYSNQSLYSNINNNLTFDYSIKTLLTTILNLSNLGFPVFGSNGPLWSLAYEWWFYVLYPILFFQWKNKNWMFYLLILMLSVCGYFNFLGVVFFDKIFQGLLCWIFGCIMADVYKSKGQLNMLYFSGIAFLCFIILTIVELPFNNDVKMSALFASLIGFCIYYAKTISKFNFLKKLGDMSYTLYIIHLPVLLMYSAFLMRQNEGSLPSHFWYVILGVISSLLIAYPISKLAERKIPREIMKIYIK